MTLESILDDLRKDPWPVPADKRVARCTGSALSVATGLMDLAIPRRGGRVMLFTGGPCTSGPGAIVGRIKTETMRSHADLVKNAEPLHQPACEYYASLAHKRGGPGGGGKGSKDKTAAGANPSTAALHAVDVFACSLDQVGMLEMGELIEATGGLMVLGDSFGQSVFKESLRRVFRRYEDDVPQDGGQLQMAFGATLEVLTSREFKISGGEYSAREEDSYLILCTRAASHRIVNYSLFIIGWTSKLTHFFFFNYLPYSAPSHWTRR